MKESLGGVTDYVYGKLEIEIGLPKNGKCCLYCRCMAWENGCKRAYCMLTGAFLPEYDKQVPGYCPAKWERENK